MSALFFFEKRKYLVFLLIVCVAQYNTGDVNYVEGNFSQFLMGTKENLIFLFLIIFFIFSEFFLF